MPTGSTVCEHVCELYRGTWGLALDVPCIGPGAFYLGVYARSRLYLLAGRRNKP